MLGPIFTRSRPGRGGGLCEDFVAGGGPGCRKRGPCGAHERSYTPVRPDGAQAPGGSRRLQGWGPRSGGGAWVCVGGACLVLGGRAARGSAQPPSGGGLPGAELSRLGLRALAGAAVWEQSVLQEFRPRPGAGALRCPHTPVFLSEKPHGQKSLAGYRPWGRSESDVTY